MAYEGRASMVNRSVCQQTACAFLIVAMLTACGGGGDSGKTNSQATQAAVFDVPSDRRISWSAGLDPVGGIPNYPSVPCNGLDRSGTTDQTLKINACITQAAANQAVFIPFGIYLVSGIINMKSNVALRGEKAAVAPWLPDADPAATTIKLTGQILFDGGSRTSNWTPGENSGTEITAGYAQGSTNITVSSATSYAVNDVIAIYQNKDISVIDDKDLTYLGEDCGAVGCLDRHVLAQYAVITAKNGNTLTINPPVYYITPNPMGQSIRKQTFNVVKAGLEDLRISGTGTTLQAIYLAFTRNCWIKGIDSFNNGGTDNNAPHVWTQFSFQNEYRDSYFHKGGSNDSGRNYGLQYYNWNSQHKIENNIIRETRHAVIFEGGGSGNAILYNYIDDNWESVQENGMLRDSSFLSEDAVANHGAHPYMNLWEGNFSADFWGDYTQGSSSHNTAFRNYFQCKNTTNPLDPIPANWVCIEIETYNRFYNLVGNVIGYPGLTNGTLLCNSNSCIPALNPAGPFIYRFGYDSNGGSYSDPQAFSTTIKHGNFDYVTNSVAHWDGGASHTLANSMYYASKPAFFGSNAWPPFGLDLSSMVGVLPAKDRFNGL